MTLNDYYALWFKIHAISEPRTKIWIILSAAKVTLVSGNIRFMRIFAGFPADRGHQTTEFLWKFSWNLRMPVSIYAALGNSPNYLIWLYYDVDVGHSRLDSKGHRAVLRALCTCFLFFVGFSEAHLCFLRPRIVRQYSFTFFCLTRVGRRVCYSTKPLTHSHLAFATHPLPILSVVFLKLSASTGIGGAT